MFLNIDKPNRTAILHEPFCTYSRNSAGTLRKPFARPGPDGGWFEVDTWLAAESIARELLPGVEPRYCKVCGDTELEAAISFRLPEEVEEREYVEGAVRRVFVNAYERDPLARSACLRIQGHDCAVCGFNFERVYGASKTLIHVHHLMPLKDVRKAHAVDPRVDLVPVCPNCHAVIHSGGGCRTLDEVRAMLGERRRHCAPDEASEAEAPTN